MTNHLSVEEYKKIIAKMTGNSKPNGKTSKRRKATVKRSVKEERNDPFKLRIMRLMGYRALSSRIRTKPEEKLAIAFADELRRLTLENRLRCVWTHPANEVAGQQSNLAQIRYAIAKAMGLVDGTPDYLFLGSDKSATLEAKIGKNGQQPNQVDFEHWCHAQGVEYATFTTVEEGLEHLEKWGFIN